MTSSVDIPPNVELYVFLAVSLNKLLNKESSCRWFETPSSKKYTRCCCALSCCGHISTAYQIFALQWRHNERDGVSNHLTIVYSTVYLGANQRKHKKIRITGLCAGNSPMTGEFLTQKASNAENVSIWWRYHAPLLLGNRMIGPERYG